MNAWINYHHLLYFKTIVEEGSVSKAALRLKIGQPTLSTQLKQFEEMLDVVLFERKHKRLILTEQGKVAYDYAKNIFRMGSEMYEVLHDRFHPQKPSVHFAVLDSIGKQIIVQLVQKALKISPCQITLSEGKSDELMRELAAHRIDLLITNCLPTGIDAKGLFLRSISKKNVGFYGAEKFKMLRKGFPKSISGVPVILPTYDSKMRADLDQWAKLNDIALNIIVESQDISVKKLLAINEFGLIPAAEHTVAGQVLRKELFEVGVLQGVQEEIYLITAQRKIENSIVSKLKTSFFI